MYLQRVRVLRKAVLDVEEPKRSNADGPTTRNKVMILFFEGCTFFILFKISPGI